MRDIEELRARIDALDERLLALLEERMAVCREVGAWKRVQGLPVRDAAREAQVLATRVAHLHDPTLAPQAIRFFETILALGRAVQMDEDSTTEGDTHG